MFPRGILDGLSVIIAVYQIYNAHTVLSEYLADNPNVGAADVMQSISSALGASFGAAQGLYAARDMAAIKAFSSASQQAKYMTSLGRLTGGLGILTYAFSGASSAIKTYAAGADLYKAYQRGDQALLRKSAIDLVAEGSLTAINGVGFIQTFSIVKGVVLAGSAEARAFAWATNSSKLLFIGMRVNLIGLAVSALQLGATVWYNKSNLSAYLQWIEGSSWGISPSGQSLAQGDLALAHIVAKPTAQLKIGAKEGVLILSMPSTTARELNQAGIKVRAYWQTDMKNNWQSWSEELISQWRLLSDIDGPLELGLPIYPNEQNAQHNIAIELHYRPSINSDEVAIIRFQTAQLNSAQQLSEVSIFKTAQLNAPLVALNIDSLVDIN